MTIHGSLPPIQKALPLRATDPAALRRLAMAAGLLFGAPAAAATLPLSSLGEGDLVLSEIMIDPLMVDDSRGEWFEIYNASGADIDLNGLVLTDAGSDSYTVGSSVKVTAGGYALLAVNGKTAYNGGLPTVSLTYTRSAFRFDNGADEVILSYAGLVFDSLAWGAVTDFAATSGVALQLDPAHMNTTDNDRAYYWCEAVDPYGLGDLGTPGAVNADCGLSSYGVDSLSRGDLIITEVMVDPTTADDSRGEWFELYNNSGVEISLYGLKLSDKDTDSLTVTTDALIAPDSYALLAVKELSGINGGLPTVDVVYVRKTFRFDNIKDEAYISNSTVQLDEVAWDGVTLVAHAGASLSLDPSAMDPDANDVASSWCDATSTYGGDLGTPAAANDTCPVDADADGYTADVDCDDADPTVNPGAPEVCNGIDDDCDGAIDLGATDITTWYLDYDQDGYGADIISVTACDNPNAAYFVDTADDCNDLSAATYPGATEVCDDADNDCNGTVDDGAVSDVSWYVDADADGYGDAATTSTECDLPTGYADNALDCDDASVAVFPGADELCDTIDNNCDGVVDEDDAVDATIWYLDYDDDGYGADKITAVACAAPTYFVDNDTDCNDLRDDLNPGETEVCGDFTDNNCDDSALDCSVTGTIDLSVADAKLTGSATYPDAGRGLASIGDVDGDGINDFVVGAPATSLDAAAAGSGSTGAAYVILGSSTALTGTLSLATVAAASFTGEAEGDQAGYSVSAAGDQNGDTYPDLLVAARDEATGGTGAGAVYLEYGPFTGAESLSAADAKFTGEGDTNVLGFVMDSGGDIDGDGVGDLAMGAYGNSDFAFEAGATYVVYGTATTGVSSIGSADAILEGEAASDRAGRWMSAGDDTDGDGLDDLLIGAYAADEGGKTDAGRAYLVLGPVSGTSSLSDADAIFDGQVAGDQAGYSVDNGGDIDGDGYGDLLIAAGADATIGVNGGAIYVVYGPVSGSFDLSLADAKLIGAVAKDHFGVSVAVVSDANGDERDDVLVGAEGNDAGGSNAGSAYMFYGPVSGTASATTSNAKFVGETKGDFAGIRIAGADDLNGDGYGDWLIGATVEQTGGTNAGAAYLVFGSGW